MSPRVLVRSTLSKRKRFEKKKLSDLPSDLVEEVISRVPLTSLTRIRLTCTTWNALCKQVAPRENKFNTVVVMMDFRLFLMSVNLDKAIESFMKPEGKLISLDDDSNQIDVSHVFHCDGLLLCVRKDRAGLVVWNPHLGQTRWLEPTQSFHRLECYTYAFGYTELRSHKILRFVDWKRPTFAEFKIYDLDSDSWRVLDVTTLDWRLYSYNPSLSLKGNAYWFGVDKHSEACNAEDSFLVCFDFTRERFGPRLHVPFHWFPEDTVSLSSVRDEQLAVLFQPSDTFIMEIWVTTKIEPDAVSWNTKLFLRVDTRPLIGSQFQFSILASSFFIDEEKKVAVVVEKDKHIKPTRGVAYIFGVDGSFKEVDIGESTYKHCFPLVCFYVPSLVQLN